LLDSREVETSVELKFEEAKSVAQLWEALPNYDAVYSHLHPLDYGPKVLMVVVVHWHNFADLGARQVAFFKEDVLMLFPQILSSSMVMEKAVETFVVYEEVVVVVVGAMVL
jgi:hypothetical protein